MTALRIALLMLGIIAAGLLGVHLTLRRMYRQESGGQR